MVNNSPRRRATITYPNNGKIQIKHNGSLIKSISEEINEDEIETTAGTILD